MELGRLLTELPGDGVLDVADLVHEANREAVECEWEKKKADDPYFSFSFDVFALSAGAVTRLWELVRKNVR